WRVSRLGLLRGVHLSDDSPLARTCTLSLHDALPIWRLPRRRPDRARAGGPPDRGPPRRQPAAAARGARRRRLRAWQWRETGSSRSEEHTSELQSRENLVCRLLLEKRNMSIHDPASTP